MPLTEARTCLMQSRLGPAIFFLVHPQEVVAYICSDLERQIKFLPVTNLDLLRSIYFVFRQRALCQHCYFNFNYFFRQMFFLYCIFGKLDVFKRGHEKYHTCTILDYLLKSVHRKYLKVSLGQMFSLQLEIYRYGLCCQCLQVPRLSFLPVIRVDE